MFPPEVKRKIEGKYQLKKFSAEGISGRCRRILEKESQTGTLQGDTPVQIKLIINAL
jgi:hypothetical protein